MSVYYFKIEGRVIKFSKKEKEKKAKGGVPSPFNISSVCSVQWWGGVGEALWEMIQKKKKIHQLRI